jgi:hypothetical protein
VNVPAHLQQSFGHGHMGIYGEVVGSGEIVTGDTVLLDETRPLSQVGSHRLAPDALRPPMKPGVDMTSNVKSRRKILSWCSSW